MGKRGRPPKPTARKKLEGTYRADRAPKNEAMPAVGLPKPELSDDAEAVWARIAPELEKVGLGTVVDWGAVARWCEYWVRWKRALAEYDESPSTQRTESGYIAPHPAGAAVRHWGGELSKLETKLGMDPSARTKIEAAPADASDGDESFLFGQAPMRRVK